MHFYGFVCTLYGYYYKVYGAHIELLDIDPCVNIYIYIDFMVWISQCVLRAGSTLRRIYDKCNGMCPILRFRFRKLRTFRFKQRKTHNTVLSSTTSPVG